MASSKKPRKRKSASVSAEKLKAFKNVQSLLQDMCIGAIQAGEHYQYTYYKGKQIEYLPIGASNAVKHVKFPWLVMIGVIHRQKNGVPKIEYVMFQCIKQYYLYSEEFSEFVFKNLKKLFESADVGTKLTTFWLASPNQNYLEEDLMARAISMLDRHKIFNQFKSNYEWDNNVEPSSTLHKTTYWYGLIDWVDVANFKLEN